ncbi:MAG: DUF4349 domain-containing protein [Ginsengibacter sp.]
MQTKFLLLLAASALFSCSRSTSSKADKDMSIELPLIQSKSSNNEILKTSNTDTVAGISLQGSAPGQNPDWDKKIIKTAVLKLEVKDFEKCSGIVHKVAKQYGGYISNEEQNQSAEKKESIISIKVPVEQFESLLNQLPSDSDKTIEKKITTEDVTGEVVDTKSRLQAKEQTRLKYLEFLKQAKNMEDVLKVQGEINNIQEEMESASGRINYLSHQSVYSTINLTFYQPLAGYNPPDDSPGFLARTLKAFKTGADFIAEIFLGIISVWPLCLLAFLIWILWKRHSWKVVAAKQKL